MRMKNMTKTYMTIYLYTSTRKWLTEIFITINDFMRDPHKENIFNMR